MPRKPPRLKRGDVVGLVCPSGVLDDALTQRAFTNLEAMGFTVKPARNLRAARGGYAGTVAERVEDLHAMFADREVRALWAARGGSGCAALLPHVDFGLVRRHPKAVVGFSDLTALHLALLRHADLVTFHGPVATSANSAFSRDQALAVLMEPLPTRVLPLAEDSATRAVAEPQFRPRTYRGGVATGRLAGGNLSVLCAALGTPYLPRLDGALLFLEEVAEAPYRVDRLLTQLEQAGVLRHAAGIALGVFQKCVPPDDEPSLTLDDVLEDRLGDSRVPCAYGLSIGHIAQQWTVPIGVRARFDAGSRTLTLLEPAVA